MFNGSARPFAVAIPILTPVKEPGPEVTAIASISEMLVFALLRQSSISSMRV